MRTYLVTSCLTIALLFASQQAWANEQAWFSVGDPHPPGPRDDTPLVLVKERVRIGDEQTTAQFWIKNPTSETSEVTMGFPISIEVSHLRLDDALINPRWWSVPSDVPVDEIEAMGWDDDDDEDETNIPIALEQLKVYWRPTTVTRDAEPVDYRIEINPDSDYPLVFLWESRIEPGQTVHDVIRYPTFRNGGTKSGGGDPSRWIDYITHTGGGWAEPIGDAKIEVCTREVRGLVKHRQHDATGETTIKEDLSCQTKDFEIEPEPHRIIDGCAIWEEHNWVPTEPDDIRIIEKTYDRDSCGPLGGGDGHFQDRTDLLYDGWCFTRPQLAEVVAEVRLTDQKLEEIFELAVARSSLKEHHRPAAGWETFWNSFEELQLLTDRLTVYRYLRNYFFALRGHDFEDSFLRRCFENIPEDPARGTSDVAKENIMFLLDREKKLKTQLDELMQNTSFPIVRPYRKFEWLEVDEESSAEEADLGSTSEPGASDSSSQTHDETSGEQTEDKTAKIAASQAKPKRGCDGCSFGIVLACLFVRIRRFDRRG